MAGYIHPNSTWKEAWNFFVLLVTLFLAVEIPLGLALAQPKPSVTFWLELFISGIFGLDLVFNFKTALFRGHNLVTDQAQIRHHYLRGWFTLDLLAAFPFFLFPGISAGGTQSVRLLRLFQLPRLFKLSRLNNFFNSWEKNHFVNPSLYRLLLFFLSISLFSHWLACLWLLLGGIPMTTDPATDYSRAIYWVITTLTTVGYGDITPATNVQRYFTIAVMIAGVGSYGYVIGNVASFLANMDIVKTSYKKKMEEVNAFLRYKSIPLPMKKRVHDYYRHLWESRMGHDEGRILDDLPRDLREDLAIYMRRELIEKVPLFSGASDQLIREVVLSLKPLVFIPGAWIMRKGEKGDAMYIVSSGSVDVVSESGEEVYATLREGSFVGEMALMLEQGRSASVRARDYCDLYVLQKKDFEIILNKHPEFQEYVRNLTADRLRGSRERKKKKGN